jgi:hypothetical protein
MTERPKARVVFLWILCIHALLVTFSVALNFVAVWLRERALTPLDIVSDVLTEILCLPIMWLLRINRVDLFFVLLPINSLVYALVLCVLWRVFRR